MLSFLIVCQQPIQEVHYIYRVGGRAGKGWGGWRPKQNCKKPDRLIGYPSAKMEKAKMKQKLSKLIKTSAISRTSINKTGHNRPPTHSPLQDTMQIMQSCA